MEAENDGKPTEARLIAAILQRAIMDAIGSSLINAAVRREAMAWLISTETGEWSCKWACEAIDLDHKKLQKIIAVNSNPCNYLNINKIKKDKKII